MTTEKLLNEIGLINDEFIAEAEENVPVRKSIKRSWRWGISAAAICTAAAMLVVLLPRPSGDSPELPLLTISENKDGMGFEGLMAFDISELANGNPWSEKDKIKTLPVFRNPITYDWASYPATGLSAEEMLRQAKEIASALGLTVDSVYTNPKEPTEEEARKIQKKLNAGGGTGTGAREYALIPYEAVAVCGEAAVTVDAKGWVRLSYEDGLRLPDEYNFTYHDTTQQQAKDVTRYLLERFAPLADMKSPALDLFGEYSYDAQWLQEYFVYESSGSLIDRILGYNFNRVQFGPQDDGTLRLIDRERFNLPPKMGDYPIITPGEARKLLLQKRYITTVPDELPDEKYIARVELIYRTCWYDEIFMPYYRFLVEIPARKQDNGLKTFGVFYVPAVAERYLDNMPLWDGSFNK